MINHKQTLLKKITARPRRSYRPNDARATMLEAIVSLGDRRLADTIEAVWRKGQVFDAWDEYLDLNKWMAALEETGVDYQYFGTASRRMRNAGVGSH